MYSSVHDGNRHALRFWRNDVYNDKRIWKTTNFFLLFYIHFACWFLMTSKISMRHNYWKFPKKRGCFYFFHHWQIMIETSIWAVRKAGIMESWWWCLTKAPPVSAVWQWKDIRGICQQCLINLDKRCRLSKSWFTSASQ